MELYKQLGADDLGMTVDQDIDDLRGQQESEASWQRRRRFLVVHHGRYPIGRLNQLSYCFTNILMYACEYSDSLMKELSALAVDVAIANSSEQGDALVTVSKNYLKDKSTHKKNALLAELHFMKKLHDLRESQMDCSKKELKELKRRRECILSEHDVIYTRERLLLSRKQNAAARQKLKMRKERILSEDDVLKRDILLKARKQWAAKRHEQKLKQLSELSPLPQSSELSPLRQSPDLSHLHDSSKLTLIGKSSELSSQRQSSELSPLRQSLELSPLRQSSECSPFEQSQDFSLFGRLKITNNKEDNSKKLEESSVLQYRKETKKTLLMGTPRLLCSDARRQAEEAKALETLKKENHESSSNLGKNLSLTSRPENLCQHDLKSVNFEPRTSCLNTVHRSSSIGLSVDEGKSACIESRNDVCSLAELTRSVLVDPTDDGSHVKEATLWKSSDHLGGERVYHSNRKGTSHLWQSSEPDTRGEKFTLSRDWAYPKRSSRVTDQGDITPLSTEILSGNLQTEKGHISRKDDTCDLPAENKVAYQRETNQTNLSDKEIDGRLTPREMELFTNQPDQNNSNPSNRAEKLTKSESYKTPPSFVTSSHEKGKESAPRLRAVIKQLESLKISLKDEKETRTNKQIVTSRSTSGEKTQREKTEGYINSKWRGEITPMTSKTDQEGSVNVSPVPKKTTKSKFPVFDLRKNLIRPENSLWKDLKDQQVQQVKGQQVQQVESESLEDTTESRQNDGTGSWSQIEHVVASQLCDGPWKGVQWPETNGAYDKGKDKGYWHQQQQNSDEPPSKTRCMQERSVSNSHSTSGYYPYSETLQTRDASDTTMETPLKHTQNEPGSRTLIKTLNESSQKMFVTPQSKSEKTIDCSVKSSPTKEALYKAQQVYRRLQRIKSQNMEENSRMGPDSGKIQDVLVGLNQILVKSDQQRVSDLRMNAPGKQFVTSAMEQKPAKQEQEVEKVCGSSVYDVKEPSPGYAKPQRKDITLYAEMLARKFSSKSLIEMSGRDCTNVPYVSKKAKAIVGREEPSAGTKTQQEEIDLNLKSSKTAGFSDKYYFKSFKGLNSFLVPNMNFRIQGQIKEHQSALNSLEVKSNLGHLQAKGSASAGPVLGGSAVDIELLKLAKNPENRWGQTTMNNPKSARLDETLSKGWSKSGIQEKLASPGQSKSASLEESTAWKTSKSACPEVSTAWNKIKGWDLGEMADRKKSNTSSQEPQRAS